MDINIVKNLVAIYTLKTGDVFLYGKKYYMVTNAYIDRYMYANKRVCIDLETGFYETFNKEEAELITNVHMVIN